MIRPNSTPILRGLLLLFLTTITFSLESQQLNLDLSAKSAILINAQTGAVLYEKEADEAAFPASITKIATALYILEKKRDHLRDIVTVSPESVLSVHASVRQAANTRHPSYRLEHDGTNMGIRAGDKLPLIDLLYGIMLASGNDASNAVAYHLSGGDIPKFVDEMNAFLREKGLKQTHFSNPHGLHHSEHFTTAHDMALLTKEGMKNPLFREIVKTVRYQSRTTPQPLMQHNKLLRAGKYFYPKAIGVKTGHIARAKFTLVAAAQDGDRTLIAVLLGCPHFEDRFKDAIKLFDAAFKEKRVNRTLFSSAYDQFSVVLNGANRPLQAKLSADLKMTYYPSEEPELKAFVHWNQKLRLPIKEGDSVGELKLMTKDGQVYQDVPIYATVDVKQTLLSRLAKVFSLKALFACLLVTGSLFATLHLLKKTKKQKAA